MHIGYNCILLLACWFATSGALSAQVNLFEGREFYVVFLQNEHRELADSAQQIHITSSNDATVRVKTPFSTGYRTYHVKAGIAKTVFCSKNAELKRGSGLSDDVYHVVSDKNVFVSAHSTMTASTDGYAVIPVRSWDHSYRILTTGTDFYQTSSLDSAQRAEDLLPRTGQFAVVANVDETRLDITPTVHMNGVYPPGERFIIVLNKGQVWHGFATPYQERNSGDLSGTLIQANKPVGVVAGHMRSSWPISDTLYKAFINGQSAGSKDHLIEMMPPVNQCGTSFVTVPFGIDASLSTRGEIYKLVTTQPDTYISYKGESVSEDLTIEKAGASVIIDGVHGVTNWTSTKPVYLAHISQTAWYCEPQNKLGDPSLLLPPAISQWVKRAVCVVPPTHNMEHYVITIVCDTSAIPQVQGVSVDELTISKGKTLSGFSWYRIQVEPRSYDISCETPMGIWVSAFGEKDSYSFPVSGGFAQHLAGQITTQIDSTCGEFSLRIESLLPLFDYTYSVEQGTAEFNASALRDTSTTLVLTITNIDISTPFDCLVRVFDVAGNEDTIRLRSEALTLDIPQRIGIPTDIEGLFCTTASVVNTSTIPVEVEGLWAIGDESITISSVSLPATLLPGKQLEIEVCIDVQEASPPPNGRILVRANCLGDVVIQVGVQLDEPSIAVSPYRFEETLVGSQTCSDVSGIVVTNTGNANILLEGLECVGCDDVFEYTGAVFPLGLRVGEQRVFEFCFNPKIPGEVSSVVSFRNDRALEATSSIHGFGVELQALTRDVEVPTIRVGRHTSASIELQVVSNTQASISASVSTTSTFRHASSLHKTYEGPLSTSITLQIQPSFVGLHNAQAHFRVEHPLITRTTTALVSILATLPDIEGTEIDLGEIPRGELMEREYAVFFSTGNEQVNVDSIVVRGEHAELFNIVHSTSTVHVDETVTAHIAFSAPNEIGTFSALALMYSDAGPGYDQFVDTTRILARAIALEDSCLDIFIQTPAAVCVPNPILIRITNVCEEPVTLHSLDLGIVSSSASVQVDTSDLPLLVLPNQSVQINGILRVNEPSSTIQISVLAQDELGITRGARVQETTGTRSFLTTAYSSSSDVVPGDYAVHTLEIRGEAEIIDTLTISHNFDATALNLEFIEFGTGERILTNAPNGNVVFKVPLKEGYEKITFVYRALFSDQLEPFVQSTIVGDCYLQTDILDRIHFDPVCLQNVRLVRFGPRTTVAVAPNPVIGNRIVLMVEASENVQADMKLLNMNGKLVHNWQNFSLKKGKHSYNLSSSALLPGLYALIVRINQTISTQYIIIN